MTRQGGLFSPGSANREEPVQARLLARRDDPATSKQATKRVVRSGRQQKSLWIFLFLLRLHGPLTAKQAGACQGDYRTDYWQVEFCKRTDAWMKAGHIRVARDAEGRERVIDGSRVWEVVSQ